MPDAERIAELIFKQLKNSLTVEEAAELQAWISESNANKEFMEARMKRETLVGGLQAHLDMDEESISRKSNERCPEATRNIVPVRSLSWRWWLAAAILTGALVIAGISIFHRPKVVRQQQDPERQIALRQLEHIMKVAEGARLTLRQGDTIYLDTVRDSFNADDWKMSKKNNHLFYLAKTDVNKATDVYYHTLSIPYGQQWQVSLPDHSQIQLSTGTALSYQVVDPDAMIRKRNFVLRGEARFDVSPDIRSSFIVHTLQKTVTAISTVFNVRDYAIKNKFLTFVEKGAVKVYDDGDSLKLEAGQAAVMDKAGVLKRPDSFDIAKAGAWTSNYFDLSALNVPQAMEVLRDWYGMDTVIIGPGVNTTEKGLVGRGELIKSSHLESMLTMLEKDHLYFQIDRKKILVTSSKQL